MFNIKFIFFFITLFIVNIINSININANYSNSDKLLKSYYTTENDDKNINSLESMSSGKYNYNQNDNNLYNINHSQQNVKNNVNNNDDELSFEPYFFIGYGIMNSAYISQDGIAYSHFMPKMLQGVSTRIGFIMNDSYIFEIGSGFFSAKNHAFGDYTSGANINIIPLSVDIGYKLNGGILNQYLNVPYQLNKVNFIFLAGSSVFMRNVSYSYTSITVPSTLIKGGYDFGLTLGMGIEYIITKRSSIRFDFKRIFMVESTMLASSWIFGTGIVFKF